jgi:cytochrome c556
MNQLKKLFIHNKIITSALLGASLLTCAVPAVQAFDEPKDAIEYRQAAFDLIAEHVGQMGAMIRNEKPFDADEFKYRANSVDALSKMPLEGFTFPGADKGQTKAKPAVFENMDDFKSRLKTFQEQAARLAVAANSGDIDTIKPAFMDTMKNCKSCHTDYKNR